MNEQINSQKMAPTPSSKAQRLLTSCSLWLNTSWRTSMALWRMFSISVTLYMETQKKEHTVNTFLQLLHFPLDVKTASPAAKDLHHHELARDKKPAEGERFVCTLHISLRVQLLGHWASGDPLRTRTSP